MEFPSCCVISFIRRREKKVNEKALAEPFSASKTWYKRGFFEKNLKGGSVFCKFLWKSLAESMSFMYTMKAFILICDSNSCWVNLQE
jgi:hypothetical protein